jgi:putative peptidoglycan lipid II flippase
LTTPPGGGPGWAAHEPPEASQEAYDDAGWDDYGYPPRDYDPDVRNRPPNGQRTVQSPDPADWDDRGHRPRGRHHRGASGANDQVQAPGAADRGYRYEPPDYQRDWQRDREAYPPPRGPGDRATGGPFRPADEVPERRSYPDPLREAMAPPPQRPRQRPAPRPWPPDERGRGGRYDGTGYDGTGYDSAYRADYDRTGYDNAGPSQADYAGYSRSRVYGGGRSSRADYDGAGYDGAAYPGGPSSARAPDLDLPRGRPPERTRVLPNSVMPTSAAAAGLAAVDQTGSFSIVRSSSVMAVGTLGSRVTGFLRTIAQSWALGAAGVAAGYNLANTLPNVVYNLALGGILTSVIVPLIVNAAKREGSRSEAYDQRMFTLITGALLAITIVAMALATPLAHLYSGRSVAEYPGAEHLTVIFAYFFIPQIFFYGFSSLIGAILNSRGSFAAPMWTPIINNFVVIAVLGLFVAVAGNHRAEAISGSQLQLLGLGTTLGIVAQTVALIPALRRVGFRWHPRFDFRRSEAREIGRMGGWMFGYVAATQVAFLVTIKLAGDANVAGVTDYSNAWLLFQLPYAVVGISVITALLPRMSAHASDRRLSLVRDDFSSGVRLSSAIVVPCSLVLAVLGPDIGEIFFGHGATTIAQAHYMGVVFAVFCLGLLPYMIFQLQLRVFYSMQDSKTPALIGFATTGLNIVANVIALNVLPANELVAGLGVGFGLANILGSITAWQILARRVGGLDGRRIGSTLVRMHAASVPAALIAIFISLVIANFMTGTRSVAFVDIVIGGGAALLLYLLFARALQVDELTSVIGSIRARLGR